MRSSLEVLRDQIALWIEHGHTPATIEAELIEPATHASEDERSALWLFAWSYAQQQRRSRRPAESLA